MVDQEMTGERRMDRCGGGGVIQRRPGCGDGVTRDGGRGGVI